MLARKYNAQPSSLLKVFTYFRPTGQRKVSLKILFKNSSVSIFSYPLHLFTELPVKWIKELDEETSAMKGQPIYMTCELNKERDVVWKKDGTVLKKKANKVQINIIGMQHAVTIQNSTEDDAGSYSCEVDGQEDVKTITNVKVIGKQNEDVVYTNIYQYSCFPRNIY